jgi:hypothetical protein
VVASLYLFFRVDLDAGEQFTWLQNRAHVRYVIEASFRENPAKRDHGALRKRFAPIQIGATTMKSSAIM